MDVRNIVIIGSGTMGSQIGMVAALSGFNTTIVDISDDQLLKAEEMLHSRMSRDVSKGRKTQEQVDEAFGRLTFTTDQETAVSDADLVIEAVTENIAVKRTIFEELSKEAPNHAILATNSSNIVSSQIADSATHPERVCNMHFFNPVLVMECCEVLGHEKTSPEVLDSVTEVAEKMGKQVVRLNKEIPGFVANRILAAIRDEGLSLYKSGVASFEDIDMACRTALRHPMGPFQLMDLTGIDVVHAVGEARYEQTGDESARPDDEITRLLNEGKLGRKTGQGWYTYDS